MTIAAGTVRIGTRGSALALAQAGIVVDALAAAGVSAGLVTIVTEGDRRAADTPWGEGAFVSAIESALLGGEIDAAVHSAKDVPTAEDPRLSIAAFLPRASPLDVLVAPLGREVASLESLPRGARVGTDSPRRTAFLRAIRPDLRLHPLHGNVDTRLRRLDSGETDFLVLAEAGIDRLGRADRIGLRLDPAQVPPAPGLGALAVQVRADDRAARRLVSRLDDRDTRTAVEAERALLAASGGGCRAPLGALGRVSGDLLELLGGYARPDGVVVAIATERGARSRPDRLAETLLARIAAGASAAAHRTTGPRIVVTRPVDQSAATVLALVDRGFAPLIVPAIAVVDGDRAALDDAVRNLGDVDWVVLTSANAVRAMAASAERLLLDLGAAPPRARFAAVGRATSAALRSAGIVADFEPPTASAAAIAESLPIRAGERVLVPRSDLADDELPAVLAQRGASVATVTAYAVREAPDSSVPILAAALAEGPAAVIVTSGSTVRGFLALADRIGAGDAARRMRAIAIGPGTAEEARKHGLDVVATARTQGPRGIAEAASAAFADKLEKP